MVKEKIVLDTNILVSAFGWDGNPKLVLGKVFDGKIELIISKKQLKELERVLDYPKLGFTGDEKIRILGVILEAATVVETSNTLRAVKEDPDDDMILESAVENNVGYIVSGDFHLLKLKEFGCAKIMTAKEFLDAFG